MYRVGLPLWKTAARLGVPVLVRVHVHQDKESGTFWADSPDLDGLVVSGSTLDELHKEVTSAADTLLEMAIDGHKANAQTEIRIRDAALCAA
jgi:predicted RNase H-like HicB family nuclease